MTALQNIIKEAKKLRAKHPNKHAKWTDYVKEASKIHNKDKKISGYVRTKRTGNVTDVVYSRAVKPTKKKKISGYVKTTRSGSLTDVIYTKLEKKKTAPKKKAAVKKTAPKKKVTAKKIEYKKQGVLFGFDKKIGDLFDTTIIKDIDQLKKQYFKLAKKYHPDAGGTTQQFQELQKEYDKLFKALLSGSDLNSEQKNNEIVIDEAIRAIIDQIITFEGISIELMGKWLWVGDTNTIYSFSTPMYNALKSAGLTYIKKAGIPYMVYKGIESSSRGKMSKEDIAKKYGVHKFTNTGRKSIGSMHKVNYTKLKSQFAKLTKAINKRPI